MGEKGIPAQVEDPLLSPLSGEVPLDTEVLVCLDFLDLDKVGVLVVFS